MQLFKLITQTRSYKSCDAYYIQILCRVLDTFGITNRRLEEDTIAELEQARKELQWDSEKRNVGLRKLRSFFLDPIEVEHIVIHAFASVSQTSTFRVLKLTDEFKIALNEARRQGWMGKRSSVSDAQRKQTIRQDALKKKKKRDEESADEPGITKLEYRRRLLKQRIREWDDFLKTKPDLLIAKVISS